MASPQRQVVFLSPISETIRKKLTILKVNSCIDVGCHKRLLELPCCITSFTITKASNVTTTLVLFKSMSKDKLRILIKILAESHMAFHWEIKSPSLTRILGRRHGFLHIGLIKIRNLPFDIAILIWIFDSIDICYLIYRATVTVTVVRNENSPVFFNESYAVTIRQDVPSGTQIQTLNARDADTAVC